MTVRFTFSINDSFWKGSFPITIQKRIYPALRNLNILSPNDEKGDKYRCIITDMHKNNAMGIIYCGLSGGHGIRDGYLYYQIRIPKDEAPSGFCHSCVVGDKIDIVFSKNANQEICVILEKKGYGNLIGAPRAEIITDAHIYPQATTREPQIHDVLMDSGMDNFQVVYLDSQKKLFEKKMCSVRTSKSVIDPHTWLRETYTKEGLMSCQICREEMPFKKKDGNYYFEAVEALDRRYFPRENEVQFLALCPVCAAKYKEFITTNKDRIDNLANDLQKSEDRLEIPLELDKPEYKIKFAKKHLTRIKMILEIEERE